MINLLKKLFLILILMIVGYESYAQFSFELGCYDSTQVQFVPACPLDFEPVCACNGETYRNECYARAEGFMMYENRVCEGLDFEFYPNPVVFNLALDIITAQEGDVEIQIYDSFGKIYFSEVYRNITRNQINLDVNNYELGIYYVRMVALSEDFALVKKFVKMKI